MSSAVHNNAALSRFELDAGGATAFAAYKVADGVVTFTHTEVPPQARDAGLGAQLVQGALEMVRTLGLKVVARCSFVRAYIGKHPEFQDLIS